MTARRRAAACWWAAALAIVAGGSTASAQSIRLGISGLSADSTSPAPVMSITAFENQPQLGPYSVSLELSLESQFRSPFFARTARLESVSFTLDSLLPERTIVYFRSRLSDAFGNIVAESRDQHPVRSWLRLVSPGQPTLTVLSTRTPTFVWSSPPISLPPGLWVYDLTVINNATDKPVVVVPDLQDTSYTLPSPLESSTSYRWQVHARAQNGRPSDQTTVASSGTFVIASPDQPTVTLLYQNFPNPFGRGTRSGTTCFWFDLAHPSDVSLIIYDISLREVRRILPGALGSGSRLPVGAYGRQNVSAQSGCDDRLSWDGHDDSGRPVPAGVYLAVFRGDNTRASVKILYKGP